MNECNVCYESTNVSKCTSCTFMCCYACTNKWTKSSNSQCPMCKKFNTFKSSKHIFYTHGEVDKCIQHTALIEFANYFVRRYHASIKLNM